MTKITMAVVIVLYALVGGVRVEGGDYIKELERKQEEAQRAWEEQERKDQEAFNALWTTPDALRKTPTPTPVTTPRPPTPIDPRMREIGEQAPASPRVHRAARMLARYAWLMGIKDPVGITVDLSPALYEGSVLAHTTRNAYAPGCTVHSTDQALDLDWVLAHEVCHCKNDAEAMNAFGYVNGTPHEEVVRREARAKTCGGELQRREQVKSESASLRSLPGWWGR